jgi:hypothetical protein
MNDVDPQAWLADVLARQSSRQQSRRLASVELEIGASAKLPWQPEYPSSIESPA